MSVRRLFSLDAGLSLLMHGLKAGVALFVNWLVLRHFAVDDFLTWSLTSSILIVATASDLGIAQYTVTRLINTPRAEWSKAVSESVNALIPLSVVAGGFVFLAINDAPLLYRSAMAILLAARIVTIPFWAVLNAVNQFKIRKVLELAGYLVAALGIMVIVQANGDIRVALVLLNATFLLSAVLNVAVAARYVSFKRSVQVAPLRESFAVFRQVFRAALPFMLINVSGLLTYGGFVWLASLALPDRDAAKLAVLHGFVLVNLYQLYDVLLKARQADLADSRRLRPYGQLNVLVMLSLPPLFLLAGREALGLIGNPLVLATPETALFGLFMAFELGNLFVQSVVQVRASLTRRLNDYSLVRSAMLASFAVAAFVPTAEDHRLIVLLALLSLGSALSFAYMWRIIRMNDVDGGHRPPETHSTPAVCRENL